MGLPVSPVAGMVDTGCTVGAAVGCTVGCAVRRGCSAACGAVVGCAVGDAVGGVVGWGSLAVTVSARVISLVAAASAKYLPQQPQYQYSLLPSASVVAATAGKCCKFACLPVSGLPYCWPQTAQADPSLQVAGVMVQASVSATPQAQLWVWVLAAVSVV